MVEDLLSEENQQLYIEAMLGTPHIYSKVQSILKPEYFSFVYQPVIKFINEYYSQYKKVPHVNAIKMATGDAFEAPVYEKADAQFIVDTVADFCKFTAVKQHVLNSAKLIQEGKLDLMVKNLTEAINIKVDEDFGINYFEAIKDRLEFTEANNVSISTGWETLSELEVYIGRKQLILFLAPSGGGKSVGMLNLGFNLLKQGLNGVYISLEMGDVDVATRLDSIITKLKKSMVFHDKENAEEEILSFKEAGSGEFYIKRMREGSTTANDVSHYVSRLQAARGIRIDFVIVDYLDIMLPNSRQNSDNLFVKEKQIAEEIRAVGFDLDCIMISASQLGRASHEVIADNKSLGQNHIQGGMSKINTCDLAVALVKREEAGEYQFEFLKTRNSAAEKKKCIMAWYSDHLRIADLNEKVQSFIKTTNDKKKIVPSTQVAGTRTTNSIEDLFKGH